MAQRSPEIPVWEWWLEEARQLLDSDQKGDEHRPGRGLIQLGKDLAKHVDRAKPFSHSLLSRFKAGEIGVTLELARALSLEFTSLPPPVFFPQSRELATEMQICIYNHYRRKLQRAPLGEVTNIFGKKPHPKVNKPADRAPSAPGKRRSGS